MKKNYIQPVTCWHKVKADSYLIALSNGTEAQQNYVGGGDAKRRNGTSWWDDEEDED